MGEGNENLVYPSQWDFFIIGKSGDSGCIIVDQWRIEDNPSNISYELMRAERDMFVRRSYPLGLYYYATACSKSDRMNE
jgi:hypothetical protein